METAAVTAHVKSIELPNGTSVVCLDRHEAMFIYKEVFNLGKYSSHGVEIPRKGLVVDVGAHIGMFSLFVKQTSPAANVLALEPIEPIVAVLERNVAGLPGCRVLPIGLAAADTDAEFTYYPGSASMSGLYADFDDDAEVIRTVVTNINPLTAAFALRDLDEKLSGRRVHCKLRRLSSLIDEFEIESIALLKVDVEKAEADVLAGIDERHWLCIEQIVLEVHDIDGRLAGIETLLTDHNFEVASVQDELFSGTDIFTLYAHR